ncbi:MAG: FMN-dependent NADH-azoreductase, partial [Actinomycetota bacterium]|nr:FMN-dependent NADH-azoreductase [Actinomycetota bacterium]
APFFRDWLEWIGVTDVSEVALRPNIATADADALREIARHEARQLAKVF